MSYNSYEAIKGTRERRAENAHLLNCIPTETKYVQSACLKVKRRIDLVKLECKYRVFEGRSCGNDREGVEGRDELKL